MAQHNITQMNFQAPDKINSKVPQLHLFPILTKHFGKIRYYLGMLQLISKNRNFQLRT